MLMALSLSASFSIVTKPNPPGFPPRIPISARLTVPAGMKRYLRSFDPIVGGMGPTNKRFLLSTIVSVPQPVGCLSPKRRRSSRLRALPRRRRGRSSPRNPGHALSARQYTPAARRGAPTLIDDNCPLPPRGADPYIGCMRHSHESPRRSREGGNLASQLHADDRGMQRNATECNCFKGFATPGHS